MSDNSEDVEVYEPRKRYSLRDRRYNLFGVYDCDDDKDDGECKTDSQQTDDIKQFRMFCVCEPREKDHRSPNPRRRRYAMFRTEDDGCEQPREPEHHPETRPSGTRRTEGSESKEAGAAVKRTRGIHRRHR